MLKKLIIASSLLALNSMATAKSATYYDCTAHIGCAPVQDVRVTSDYAKTQYPIVLAHGALFPSKLLGEDWWYGIGTSLTQHGATVYQAEQSSFNSSYVRGEQLKDQVDMVLAATQADKVNIFGHSHGGQSARYLAEIYPTVVASITAIGTPHKGSDVADFIKKASDTLGEGATQVVAGIVNAVGNLLNYFSGDVKEKDKYTQNALDTLAELISEGAVKFNADFPDGVPTSACGEGSYESKNGAKLYSWGGSKSFTNMFDPVDYVLGLSGLMFKGEPNDGLTGRCSAHFGRVLRDDYRMNHADQVNQLFGMVDWFEANPVSVHRQQANRLKNDGL